jgi:hypothetical protein
MNELKEFIDERIDTLEERDAVENDAVIAELLVVLEKIEELEK